MLFDTFSKRQARARGEKHDVLIYDEIPTKLRNQVIHIFLSQLGTKEQFTKRHGQVYDCYKNIFNILCREFGVFSLHRNSTGALNEQEQLFKYIQSQTNVEQLLDAIELGLIGIDKFTRSYKYKQDNNADAHATDAIEEFNARALEAGVGYRFEAPNILRIDSEFCHAEVVIPALTLLHSQEFNGAESEFHSAHAHYRNGEYSEALVDCLKSLESVWKTIADRRGWAYSPNATASVLIKLMFENGLIPPFWETHFGALRTTVETGVPVARNKRAGHGQGATVLPPPPAHLVAFVIHQTAAAIVFFAEADKALL